MMDRHTLELFCRQLAHWAESAIENGRSPFRRTETFFPLLTAAGEISPPLLLWINRDSFMAGGVILFPSRAAEEALVEGCACAQALGLRHFVTWAAREVVIWEVVQQHAIRRRALAMPVENESPELFCAIFRALLDELKPLSITGAVAPAELSPFYLANLCRLTVRAITPLLGEAFRIVTGERPEIRHQPSSAALQQAYLLLLRSLALLLEDRLPPAIEPEGLDRALRFALDSLPAALHRSLEIQSWEIPLPPAAAVRLQHLNHRLMQLRLAGDGERGRQTVEIFLDSAAAELGAAPLPPNPSESALPALLLYPDRCFPSADVVAEIAPPAILAFTALLRHLRGESPVVQAAHPLALGEVTPPVRIQGIIPGGVPLVATEGRALATHLRLSWPNRRFPLPIETPRWLYEFLHLLGLAGEGAHIVLDLPDDWLTASWGANIHAILREHFAVVSLERRPHGIRIELLKTKETFETTRLLGAAGERTVPWARLRAEAPSYFPLALDLPDAVWTMLQEGKLQVPKKWPAAYDTGIYLFSRSSLGRLLWQVVAGNRHLPPRQSLSSHLQRFAMPLPEIKTLHDLQALSAGEKSDPGRAGIDRELARWLGSSPVVSTDAGTTGRKSSRHRQEITEEVMHQIRRFVFADGLPQFPDQYLYDHYRPELIEYRFAGPLSRGEEFLGQQNLRDGEGKVLTVEGNETARALLLASFGSKGQVLLPADRHLTAKILESYLERLRTLRGSLLRESHRRLSDPGRADALAEKIWANLPLPPWPLIAE